MESIKSSLALIICLLFSSVCYGQAKVEMADQMRADGKIYVVVGIILIVLGGLVAYLFLMDRKVQKLEDLIARKSAQNK